MAWVTWRQMPPLPWSWPWCPFKSFPYTLRFPNWSALAKYRWPFKDDRKANLILDIGHSHMFVQWMSTLLFLYWTLDIHIGLYGKCVLCFLRYWTLDIHIGLYSECLFWVFSILYIGHSNVCTVNGYHRDKHLTTCPLLSGTPAKTNHNTFLKCRWTILNITDSWRGISSINSSIHQPGLMTTFIHHVSKK